MAEVRRDEWLDRLRAVGAEVDAACRRDPECQDDLVREAEAYLEAGAGPIEDIVDDDDVLWLIMQIEREAWIRRKRALSLAGALEKSMGLAPDPIKPGEREAMLLAVRDATFVNVRPQLFVPPPHLKVEWSISTAQVERAFSEKPEWALPEPGLRELVFRLETYADDLGLRGVQDRRDGDTHEPTPASGDTKGADRRRRKQRRRPLQPVERPMTDLETHTLEVVGRHRRNFAAAAEELRRDPKTVRENYERAMRKLHRTMGHKSRSVDASALPTNRRGQQDADERGLDRRRG